MAMAMPKMNIGRQQRTVEPCPRFCGRMPNGPVWTFQAADARKPNEDRRAELKHRSPMMINHQRQDECGAEPLMPRKLGRAR